MSRRIPPPGMIGTVRTTPKEGLYATGVRGPSRELLCGDHVIFVHSDIDKMTQEFDYPFFLAHLKTPILIIHKGEYAVVEAKRIHFPGIMMK